MKIACVAIVKNEERHIAEWLAWQFTCGFDTVLLFDNNSTDRTAAIARAFAPEFDVRVRDWPSRTPKYQIWAYEYAARTHAAEFDWLAFFDTDEFLVLDDGLDLKTLLAARAEPAVAVPWAIFGSSGHQDIPDGLVIEAFTHRAPAEFLPNRHFKTILRPYRVRACRSPHNFDCGAEYVDLFGNGLALDSAGNLAAPPVYRGAKLHHYFTRSRAQWREKLDRGYPDTTREDTEFSYFDRNEVFDDGARRYANKLTLVLAAMRNARRQAPRVSDAGATAGPRFGIAITTLNRRALVLEQVAKIRSLTTMPFELVICDDGSSDGTVEVLRAQGERVIGGVQRGIAWNKNRGIFYLLNVANCDVVLLLDDDIIPIAKGWEREWVEAAQLWGHVNQAHPAYRGSVVRGALTAADPGLAGTIPGWALAFSRIALAGIGYFDIRFGRYGHEHSDLSFRAVRAGFGGVEIEQNGASQTLFYVIEGGLAGVPSKTTGTSEDLETNARLLGELGKEQIYRHAWRDDAGMADFLAGLSGAAPEPKLRHDGKNGPAARPRHFDLGVLHTIREIRVMQPWRLNGFTLSVSIDGSAWADLVTVPEPMTRDRQFFAWTGPGTAWGRFVCVAPLGQGDFDDGRIEVFGQK